VPYKSVVAGLGDLLGGHVQMMFAIAQVSSPHVLTGRLRALAITSTKRSAVVTDVPTMAQAGYPDCDGMVGWNGVHVPAKTPRAIVTKINADIAKVLVMPDIRERMLAAGFDPVQMSVDEFDAFVKRDLQRYAKAIKESRIQVE
jgi:tripartite-type tricarboxylate transporter receptor subunit TctC